MSDVYFNLSVRWENTIIDVDTTFTVGSFEKADNYIVVVKS